jgi:hypothetical protein
MAAEARSLQGMTTDPSQTHPSPRPKGFVRRNWCALALLVWSIALACVGVRLRFNVAGHPVCLSSFEGGVAMVISDEGGTAPLSLEHYFRRPNFGFRTGSDYAFAWPGLEGIRYFHFRIALWMILLVPAAWIALREWRRKRAAKGKACPG